MHLSIGVQKPSLAALEWSNYIISTNSSISRVSNLLLERTQFLREVFPAFLCQTRTADSPQPSSSMLQLSEIAQEHAMLELLPLSPLLANLAMQTRSQRSNHISTKLSQPFIDGQISLLIHIPTRRPMLRVRRPQADFLSTTQRTGNNPNAVARLASGYARLEWVPCFSWLQIQIQISVSILNMKLYLKLCSLTASSSCHLHRPQYLI